MENQEATKQIINQKKMQLKALQEKCELQNKKIKLFRKENQEIKHALARQAQIDTSLLLNSKELSDANTKLQSAIHDISIKLQIDLQNPGSKSQIRHSKPVQLVTLQNTTVTQQTEEIDMPNQSLTDEDIQQLYSFKRLKSLILGQNKIGNLGVATITNNLINITKLQLNANSFNSQALQNIGNLKDLKVLDIRNNNLGDNCMKYLSKISNLTQLSISKNGITDNGVKQIVNLNNLVYLDLTTNLITDNGSFYIIKLKKLTHLYLMANRVTEIAVLECFKELPKLEVLDVRFAINDQSTKEMLRQKKPASTQLFC